MKFLGHKFLIIVAAIPCLIFGLLFFSQPANAASVTNLGLTNGGDINIPAHSADTIVFCAFAPDSNSGFHHSGVSQFRLNGAGLGVISMNREVIDNWYQYFYTIDPAAGTYTIQKYSSYDWRDIYWSSNVTDGNQVVSCIMIDGIDTANPIKQYQFMGYDNGSGTKDFVNGTIGNIVMLSAQNFSSSDLTLTSNLNDLLPDKRFAANDWHNNLYSWATITNTTITYTVSGLGGANTQYSAVEFNTIADSGGGIEIIDAQTVEGLYFRFDKILNTCRVNMSCKIGFNFDTNIFGKDATGKLYYYASSTSTPSYLGEINLNTQGQLGIYGSGNLVATSSTPSTAYSYYQVIPHSDVWGKDYATTTAAVWFLSESDFTAQYDDIWNASNAIMAELGIDTYKLACTDEQWAATSSIPFLGVNVERMVCNTKKWVLDVGIKPMEALINQANKIKSKLLGVFPFNLIYKIQNGYEEATKDILGLIATPVYAGEISTTTGVYSGDFSFKASDLFGDGKGTTTITLLSKENMENLIGVDGFNVFNIVCRLLVWTAFLAYCWWIATVRLHNVMGGNEQE